MKEAEKKAPPLPAPSARSLLLTVLGEFGYFFDRPIWTSTLIEVMRVLGVEDLATRQAIQRSATAGWIVSERRGREVAWRLAPQGREFAKSGIRRATEFLEPPAPWDGQWFSLMVSMPDLPRAERRRFHGALAWLQMGRLSTSLWVSPRVEVAVEVREVVKQFDLADSSVGVSGRLAVGLSSEEIVQRAWDLTDLRESYERLLDAYSAFVPADDDELLVAYLTLRNLLQRFMRLDPMLPIELHPSWIGREAAELFDDRWRRWTGPARARWLELVTATSPDVA